MSNSTTNNPSQPETRTQPHTSMTPIAIPTPLRTQSPPSPIDAAASPLRTARKRRAQKRPRENFIYTAIVTPRKPKYHTASLHQNAGDDPNNTNNTTDQTAQPPAQPSPSTTTTIPASNGTQQTHQSAQQQPQQQPQGSGAVSRLPKRMLFTESTFAQHTYMFSFTKQQRLQALTLIFSFHQKLGPALAAYLMSCALGPGQANFDAVWCDLDDTMVLVGVLDCDVTEDSLVGHYRAKVAERLDAGFDATGKLASASLMSEKKFEVPLLHLFPIKEQTRRWERLAEALDHVRFFCSSVNASDRTSIFSADLDCSVMLQSLQSVLDL